LNSVDFGFSQVESVLKESIVESLTALVACGAAFALSYYFGSGRAPSLLMALLLGAASGVGFAVIFFIMTVAVTVVLPGTFNARSLGVHLIVLLAVAPLGAAAVAVFARYYAMGRLRF
jgi:hypothetical protein